MSSAQLDVLCEKMQYSFWIPWLLNPMTQPSEIDNH